MAKLELTLRGDFDTVVQDITDAILQGSISASQKEKPRGADNGIPRCFILWRFPELPLKAGRI